MTAPNLNVVANDMKHLTDKVRTLEAKVEAIMLTQRWQMGAAAGMGVFVTILLPKVSAALGLTG